jgi:polyisoprenoid-binding protein YceI
MQSITGIGGIGKIGLLAAALLIIPHWAGATTYAVDKSHTSVSFKVRHLFTNVAGRFSDFSGTLEFDPANPTATKVQGEIEAASIDTNNDKRDEHLRSADFFDVAKHPKITFTSTKVSDIDTTAKTAKIHGTLTLHGVTKPVVLDVAYLGTGKDPWGNMRSGFRGTTTVNRKDFGLNWNETLETGGVLVGEEVTIEINVEGLMKDE